MNITTNYTAPTFGKLKVNTSNMTREQKNNSEKLDKSLKYNDGYNQYEDSDIDVFILPKKDSNSKVEIRYADPYSGKFFRDENCIIRQTFDGKNAEEMTKSINYTLKRIEDGAVKRPKQNREQIFTETTEVCKYKEDYMEGLANLKEEFLEEGHDEKSAEDSAIMLYPSLHEIGNMDEDF